MVARIEHPNVVPLYDFWRGPGAAMLVMRLMHGGSLTNRLEDGELDLDAISRLVDQIGGALATAHSVRVAHGDVKAGNVLLSETEDFFLSDFGIATDMAERGTGSAQQGDVIAFAKLIDRVAAPGALTKEESALVESARAGEFSEAGDWLVAWRRVKGAPSDSPTYTPSRNPYKGLAAFTELDAQDFHGRSAVTSELVDAVSTRGLVAVVGPSGVGKSSVVRAGLLPALRGGAVEGSDTWLIASCVPGSHPFERLATALMTVASNVPHDLEQSLRSDERSLIKAVERYLPADSELLLVIDQFEELFTLTTDEDARERFLEVLRASVEDPRAPVRILVTVRADFFDRPLRHPRFGELLRAGTVPISAPTEDEMRSIITQPAAGVGVEFESGLVERMLAEVMGQAGALPLVEFALTEIFEQRETDRLTLDAYESSGGVAAALARRTEEIFTSLDPVDQSVAREVFMRLVTPGEEGGRDTRHRLRRTELIRLGLEADAVDRVLGRFGDHRLLTFDRDEITRGSTVEVAHEALLREWPRLTGWIDTHRQELVLRNRLAVAVGDWEESGRDDSHLLAGGRLAQHEAWAETAELPLSGPERDLLTQSRLAEEARLAGRRRRRRLTMGGFAAAAVVGVILALVALQASRQANENEQQALAAADEAEAARAEAQESAEEAQANEALAEEERRAADEQRDLAEGRAVVAAVPGFIDSDPQLSLLLSIEAARLLGDVPSVRAALRQSLAFQPVYEEIDPAEEDFDRPIGGLVGDISPDGRVLVSALSSGNSFEVRDVDFDVVHWSHRFDVGPAADYQVSVEFVNQGREILAGLGWYPDAIDPETIAATPATGARLLPLRCANRRAEAAHACGIVRPGWPIDRDNG